MGMPRGGGYDKKPALEKNQIAGLQQFLQQALGNQQQAAQGYQQFLPGGGGGQPIIEEAQKRFQQETIPQILNAFGANNKGSSALNQALAAGGANLNSNLASQLSQMQLGAAQGLGGLSQSQGQLGATTPTFAYLQRQPPLWQQLLLGGVEAGGRAAQGWLGAGK